MVLLPLLRNIRNRFGLFPVRSPLLRESFLFSFPRGTKMFQFPPFASLTGSDSRLAAAGLSHSEISGSKVICTYPGLIAAYHVLHRLHEPRHPPYALFYFLSPYSCYFLDKLFYLHFSKNGCSYFQLYCFDFGLSSLDKKKNFFFRSFITLFTLQFCLFQYVKDRMPCNS